MTAEVITHARFQKAGDLDALREAGVEVMGEIPTDADLDLKAPIHGEIAVGEATDDEMLIYAQMVQTLHDREKFEMELTRAGLAMASDKAVEANTVSELIEKMTGEQGKDEDKAKFFRFAMMLEMLKSTLYFRIGERLDLHHFRLAIRTNRRIVKLTGK